MDKYIGRLLDNRYEILEVIGTGGMAVVYKARCHRLNRLVAIKILRAEYTQDEEFRSRFHAESRAVAMLSHPNIVSVYDVSTTDEADYIVMELIDGITLKQYMERKGTLNWKETLHFAIQIAKALDHAHSRGIIHRDIKPHNVMVLKNGSVKVTDFGIARVMSESNTLTKEALGSVHYISPEQAKGGNVDNRSDLYSLGVVMYEMSTGRPPYDGETPVAVAIQHINSKATPPTMLNPNIPGGLEQIIVRSMSHNPADRYPSAGALLTDLDEFRKNPTILFDYNNPDADIDAAIRMHPPGQRTEPIVSQTGMPEYKPERTAPPKQHTAPANKNPRKREVIVEEKEERSKVATIAIIVCAVVALIAIGLLCFAILDRNSANEEDKTEQIKAPNLVGQFFEENRDYGDVVVEISSKEYNDEYEKNKIIEQSPVANAKISKGDTIRVVVSLGPQPKEKVMVDLSMTQQEWAIKFLDDMDLDLNYLPRNENSSTVEKGCVIRTNPIEGEPLQKGQTVILWISSGPQTLMADMPKVETYSRQVAENMLNSAGFQNVEVLEEENEQPAGTVLKQYPVPEDGLKYDVNTTIILTVSKGPAGSGDLTPPEPTPDNSVELVITEAIPFPVQQDSVLTIYDGTKLVAVREVLTGTVAVQLKLRGEGIVTFTAMLNSDETTKWEIMVDFTNDDEFGA